MEKRVSKYNKEHTKNSRSSRANKNKYLYDDANKKVGYEGIVDLTNLGKISLYDEQDQQETRKTRVEKNQIFNDETPVETEEKVYDINSVLEEAKKNRTATEEADKRRKLQDMEYNILNDLNQKYLSKKEKMDENLEKEGIRELIDTITSNTLVQDIQEAQADDGKDLMSDLMATNVGTALSNEELQEEIAKEILVEEEKQEQQQEEEYDLSKTISDSGKIVNSFYTRSMDLSEQDFEIRDEIKEENKAKRKIILLVILIILILIAIASFFVLKEINII